MNRNPGTGRPIALYLTGEHDCSYLPDLAARTLFVDPLARIDAAAFQSLLEQGFRRSGSHIYRPACRCCRACISLRLPVEGFEPNRSQRRNFRLNAPQVRVTDRAPTFQPEHFALYRRYLQARHPEGAMAEGTGENYRDFLVDPWGGETRLLEFRLDERLMAVAVTDVTPGGLSAVYTFFDPDLSDRAPGTFAILCQIEAAKGLGLPYLYLGYWIEACGKMSYKSNFRPLDAWNGREWERFGPGLPVRPRPPRSPSRS
jgi:arginyl-tRNA--protein-N-Asp/Glu arginylyltransferase